MNRLAVALPAAGLLGGLPGDRPASESRARHAAAGPGEPRGRGGSTGAALLPAGSDHRTLDLASATRSGAALVTVLSQVARGVRAPKGGARRRLGGLARALEGASGEAGPRLRAPFGPEARARLRGGGPGERDRLASHLHHGPGREGALAIARRDVPGAADVGGGPRSPRRRARSARLGGSVRVKRAQASSRRCPFKRAARGPRARSDGVPASAPPPFGRPSGPFGNAGATSRDEGIGPNFARSQGHYFWLSYITK